eukprot:1146849-Pelagomonas_calceolata.AAC.6
MGLEVQQLDAAYRGWGQMGAGLAKLLESAGKCQGRQEVQACREGRRAGSERKVVKAGGEGRKVVKAGGEGRQEVKEGR